MIIVPSNGETEQLGDEKKAMELKARQPRQHEIPFEVADTPDNQQSTINNQQPTINNQQSTINNQQSTITNQQSTTNNQRQPTKKTNNQHLTHRYIN